MTTGPESPLRDAALDAAWRAHSLDEPPAHLDAAILAAAQDAVAAGPREVRPGAARVLRPQRWWMPLAAAAMISAVVIGVSRLVPQNQAATAPYAGDLPERDAAPLGASPPGGTILLESQQGSARVPDVGATQKPIAVAPPPIGTWHSSGSPAPAPPDASIRLSVERGATTALGAETSGGVAASEATRADQPSAPARPFASEPLSASRAGASPALAGKTAARANAQDAATPDADAWLARVRELYDEGKLTEAAKELVALRAALPDADRRLPPELQKWAATVEP